MRKVVFSACLFWLVKAQLALAYAVDWSGRYRFEWTQLERPTLGTPGERKSYILHSLLLDGRLIASDGVNLVARFDVLSNPYSAYQHEQHGMIWGGGYAGPTPSNTVTSTVPTSGIRTTQLYLDVNTENAALLLGRAPYHFGMGMFFDAGRGPWDHWNNNRDLIAAKFIVNNVHFSPILSRWAQQDYGQGNVVQEEIFELVYDRKDTRVQLGLMTARRTASSGANDSWKWLSGTTAADVQGGYSVVRNHLFFGRAWDRFAFRLEGGSVNGSTGVLRSGQDVRQNGYGFALELEFPNPVSKWEFSTKAGIASGDDPATNDYEGFNFSRNYDVALLMFNHRQGSPALKIHSTEAIRDSSLGLTTSLDDEAIGNAVYLAPRLKYRWSERVDINNTFILAQTVVRTLANVGMDVNLGWEWDLDLDWRMRDNFSWMARLGYMVPGSAWRGGTNNYDNSPNTGLEIKAALTF